MRHLLANLVTYTIAVLLVVGAAMFGRMRASQFLLTREQAVLAGHQRAEPGFQWRELGRSAYIRNCQNCHGVAGRGWDQYPPLSPARALIERPGGREFLIDTHLYGIDSDRWRAPMPRMGHMHDVELAAVINYVLAVFGGADLSTGALQPAEVAARRGLRLSPADVDAARPDDRPDRRERAAAP